MTTFSLPRSISALRFGALAVILVAPLLAIGCGDVVHQEVDAGTGGAVGTTTASSGGSTTTSSGTGGSSSPCPVDSWARRYGDTEDQFAEALVVDGACNLYVAARVTSAVDFGNGPLQGAKFYAGTTLAKLNSTGEAVWSTWIESSTGNLSIAGLALDSEGNLILTGTFKGTFDLGLGPVAAGANGSVHVAKLDPLGHALWVRQYEATNGFNAYGSHVVADAAGDLVITGAFNGTVDFGTGPLTSVGQDIFILKLDASGATRWSERFGGPGNTLDQVASVAVGPGREIVVTGTYQGALDFGTGPLSQSSGGTFLAILDEGGKAIWSRNLSGTVCGFNSCPLQVAVEPSGRIVIAGSSTAAVVDPTKSPAIVRIVVDALGEVVSQHEPSGFFVHGIAREKGGDWFLTGAIDGGIVTRIDENGNVIWTRGTLGPVSTFDYARGGRAIALDPAGNLLVAGSFSGTIDLGSGPLASAGKHDIFIAKLSPE